MNNSNVAEEVAKILLDINAITIRPDKPFRYTTGILSPVYSDLRLLMSYPQQRKRVINLLKEIVEKAGIPDVIAGTATAGIPHAAWLADTLNLPMVYVRSKAKEHGKQNQVEGLLKNGQTAIIIEDLISTAKSSLATMQAINSMGAIADTIIAIFDYTLPQSKQNIDSVGAKLYSLTTFPTVIKIAVQEGYMQEKDKEVVLDWLVNSLNWGKKMGFE